MFLLPDVDSLVPLVLVKLRSYVARINEKVGMERNFCDVTSPARHCKQGTSSRSYN
jgi:hypothetical protein